MHCKRAFDFWTSRDPKAKMLLSKLKEMRSSVHGLLEARILLVERCQVLQSKKVKQLPRHELQSHLSAIKQSGLFELPLKLKLDLYERQCGDMMMDYFEAAEMTDLGLLQRLCTKFKFWSPVDSPLNELDMTAQHILHSEGDVLQRSGLTKEEKDQKSEQLEEAVPWGYGGLGAGQVQVCPLHLCSVSRCDKETLVLYLKTPPKTHELKSGTVLLSHGIQIRCGDLLVKTFVGQ